MRFNRDRYASELGGTKRRMENFDACIDAVRTVYPKAYAEGSTGYERSWWVEGELIGHSWPTNPRDHRLGAMWLRVKDKS